MIRFYNIKLPKIISQNSPYALEVARNPANKQTKVIMKSIDVKLAKLKYEKLNVFSRIYIWFYTGTSSK